MMKLNKGSNIRFVFILGILLLTACGGGGGSDTNNPVEDSSDWDQMVWDQGKWK